MLSIVEDSLRKLNDILSKLPLSKSTNLGGEEGVGTSFVILFRWTSNFSIANRQQIGQILSDKQGNLCFLGLVLNKVSHGVRLCRAVLALPDGPPAVL